MHERKAVMAWSAAASSSGLGRIQSWKARISEVNRSEAEHCFVEDNSDAADNSRNHGRRLLRGADGSFLHCAISPRLWPMYSAFFMSPLPLLPCCLFALANLKCRAV